MALFMPLQVGAQRIPLEDDLQVRNLPVGEYHGVIPGSANPPAVDAKPGCTPIHATWLGFQMMPDGSSRFFVQLTSALDVQVDDSQPQKLIINLENVRVAGRNNLRPLETHVFNTPVTKAYLQQKKKDVNLVFEMRYKALPVVSNQLGSDGYHFILFSFPGGNYLPKTERSKNGKWNIQDSQVRDRSNMQTSSATDPRDADRPHQAFFDSSVSSTIGKKPASPNQTKGTIKAKTNTKGSLRFGY